MNHHIQTENNRLFIAIDMPDPISKEVKRIQSYFKSKELFKGTYPANNGAHLTLKFLGDVENEKIPVIETALRNIECTKMAAQLSNVGIFTAGRMIKVVYIDVICPELTLIAKQIDNALIQWFEPERRPFAPHITLARVKDVHDRELLLGEINRFQVNKLEFIIDHFVIKQSILSAQGPQYKDIVRFNCV